MKHIIAHDRYRDTFFHHYQELTRRKSDINSVLGPYGLVAYFDEKEKLYIVTNPVGKNKNEAPIIIEEKDIFGTRYFTAEDILERLDIPDYVKDIIIFNLDLFQ